MDIRTTAIIDELVSTVPNEDKDFLKPLCGLPLSPYFSALKLKWLLDNKPQIRLAANENRCLFGTVDTWIMWNLTKGVQHVTDVTNASRTMLMNLKTLKWDPVLTNFFGIPESVLPSIRSSSEIYGHVQEGPLRGIPISGCLGDQQAALVGQQCMDKGEVTYSLLLFC